MSRQKHHYASWSNTPPPGTEPESNTVFSHCTACKVPTKHGRIGGMKFLVNGKWVSKRPTCQPKVS